MIRTAGKGEVEHHLLYIILGLVGFFLILTFIMSTLFRIQEPAGDETCRDALIFTDYVATKLKAESLKPFPKACEYEQVELKSKNPIDVEKDMVKLMERCWYKMGSGKIEPFDRSKVFFETNCFICFIASVPNMEGSIDDDAFTAHLQSIYRTEGQRYFEYFGLDKNPGVASFGIPLGKVNDVNVITEPITNEKQYAIVYIDVATPEAQAKPAELISDKKPVHVSKLYIAELNDAKECYDPSWFVTVGDTRARGD